MSGILELLDSPMGKQLIGGIAGQTGNSEVKTASVLSMAMPLLMGAMKKNASTTQGAEGLMNALNSKHNGSILDNLGGLFNGGVDQSLMNDGAGILGHLLGNKQSLVENTLSKQSGLDTSSVAEILKIAAPILMGFLGKQKSQNNLNDPDGLSSLLGSMLGGQPQQNQSLITRLLDSDGDGSVLDDVADMVLGNTKKKGGLGGMIGGLFGK